MKTAASGSSRTGRVYWAMVLLVMVIVLVITGYSVGWLDNFLAEPADPNLTAGDQAGLELSARLALVNWVIAIGVLTVLGFLAFLVRRWMVTLERQASIAEAQLAATREQLELTQTQLGLSQEAATKQAETADMNLRSDRFSRAILQATGGSAALRAVGLLALEDLVVEYEGQFATSIYEFLVALIKEKSTPDPEQRHLFESVSEPGMRSLPQIPPLDSDVETAVAILTRNRELFDRNAASLSEDTERNGGTGLHLMDLDLSGVWLRGINLSGATLTNVRLNNAVLVETDLSEAVMTNSRASDATFDDIDFTKARFHSSTFAESTFTNVQFDRATVSATDFGAAAITKSSFKRSNATGTGFVGAVFTDTTFDEALLTGTSFHGALFTNLGGAVSTFVKSTLSSVAFNETTFAGTDFASAAINDADYTGARLTEVGFVDAHLRQTNFASATLSSVSFDDADLYDVRFDEATLENTTITPVGADLPDSAANAFVTHPPADSVMQPAAEAVAPQPPQWPEPTSHTSVEPDDHTGPFFETNANQAHVPTDAPIDATAVNPAASVADDGGDELIDLSSFDAPTVPPMAYGNGDSSTTENGTGAGADSPTDPSDAGAGAESDESVG